MVPDRGYPPYSRDFYDQIEKEIAQMRDNKGKFVHGHPPIAPRDGKTGKFVKKALEKTVEEEVDELLARMKLEGGVGD